MKATKESIRESIVELLGEGAWQYACYNFDMERLIVQSVDKYDLAEKIQDMIVEHLNGNACQKEE